MEITIRNYVALGHRWTYQISYNLHMKIKKNIYIIYALGKLCGHLLKKFPIFLNLIVSNTRFAKTLIDKNKFLWILNLI